MFIHFSNITFHVSFLLLYFLSNLTYIEASLFVNRYHSLNIIFFLTTNSFGTPHDLVKKHSFFFFKANIRKISISKKVCLIM